MQSRKQEIYALLVRRIVRGKYSEETTLPSERDFADEFETSRTVIREVMKRLHAEGYIEMASLRKRRVTPGQSSAVFDRNSRIVAMIGAQTILETSEEKLGISQRRQCGLFMRLQELGFSTFHLSLSWPPTMIMEYLATYKVRGLIYFNEENNLPPETEEFLYRRLAGQLPIATFGDTESLTRSDTPGMERCLADHRLGPRFLFRHLASRGCRRVLWYYPYRDRPSLVWHKERQSGYEEAALEFGIELIAFPGLRPTIDHVGSQASFIACSRVIAQRMAPYFKTTAAAEAIVVDSDSSVPFFQRALREIGITPGGKIPVIGYDNYYFQNATFRWEPTPPAATIDKNDRLIGERCVDLIERRILAEEELSVPFHEVISPRLILPEDNSSLPQA